MKTKVEMIKMSHKSLVDYAYRVQGYIDSIDYVLMDNAMEPAMDVMVKRAITNPTARHELFGAIRFVNTYINLAIESLKKYDKDNDLEWLWEKDYFHWTRWGGDKISFNIKDFDE